MHTLANILLNVNAEQIIGSVDITINSITFDSREAGAGSLFFAVKGTKTDGHNYIESVIEKGSVAIICEDLPENISTNITYIKVTDSSFAAGIIAANWYGNPSEKLKLVGITGTNGKTTTVTLLFNLFRKLGYHVGMLSTILNRIDDEIIPSTHTTPDAIRLNQLLSRMVSLGCSYCFIEVSSHAVVQNRIAGLVFSGGIFSNITHEYAD